MADRKIEQEIQAFIDDSPSREAKGLHKCLLIDGMRQIGKTFSIRRALGFPEKSLTDSVASYISESLRATSIYIDFHLRKELQDVFATELSAEALLRRLSLLPEFRSIDLRPSPDNRILLALDEIQDASEGTGIDALKYLSFVEGLTVIASGSLVGVALRKLHSFPVGYVDRIRMRPMDFEEFLWAKGYSKDFVAEAISLSAGLRPLPPTVHEELSEIYRQFLLVGGMPEVVLRYIEQKRFDPASIYGTARNLLSSLESDLGKYADPMTEARSRQALESLPRAIAKERSRFFFSDISKTAKARDYDSSLTWLKDSGLVLAAKNLSRCDIPLKEFEREDSEKLYVSDNGLFFALSGLDAAYAIEPGENHMGKGPLYENGAAVVLNAFLESLHYYSNAKGLEVDFVLSMEGRPVLLEIKSSANKRSRSLKAMMEETEGALAVRSGFGNIGLKDGLLSLSAYLLPFLPRILPFIKR